MRYITVGSGSGIPQSERSSPCHLVCVNEKFIVVDLGPGSLWGLVRHGGVAPTDVDLVLFTHLHMDHCADLGPLLFALRARELVRTKPLTVIGPEGLLEHYSNLKGVWAHRVDPAGFELSLHEWEGDRISFGSCVIDAALTNHSITNLAWRIDDQKEAPCGIVLTGDGSPTRALEHLAASGDHILVAESAAVPGHLLDGHMNPSQAGDLAQTCLSKKLVLTHINPGSSRETLLREAMAQFNGEVFVAEDGMEIEIA